MSNPQKSGPGFACGRRPIARSTGDGRLSPKPRQCCRPWLRSWARS